MTTLSDIKSCLFGGGVSQPRRGWTKEQWTTLHHWLGLGALALQSVATGLGRRQWVYWQSQQEVNDQLKMRGQFARTLHDMTSIVSCNARGLQTSTSLRAIDLVCIVLYICIDRHLAYFPFIHNTAPTGTNNVDKYQKLTVFSSICQKVEVVFHLPNKWGLLPSNGA